mgnify:CR=1 FL=1
MIPQDLFQKEKQEPVRAQLATVTQVTEDGVMLLIDGENDAGQTACRYSYHFPGQSARTRTRCP